MNRNRELPKGYSPDAMEEKWYTAWMQRGLFDAEVDPSRPAFSIVILIEIGRASCRERV